MRRVLATTLATVSLSLARAGTPTAADPIPVDQLVVVSQIRRFDLNGDPWLWGWASQPGCHSLSIFRLGDQSPVFRLPTANPDWWPVSLAASSNLGTIFASRPGENSGNPETRFLEYYTAMIRLAPAGSDLRHWATLPALSGTHFPSDLAPAIMGDDDTLLTIVDDLPPEGPDTVAKYLLHEVAADGKLGPRRGSFRPPIAEIAPFWLNEEAAEETCDRPRFADVALALDLSTSMRLPTASGAPKLHAALQAAHTFVQLFDLSFDPAGHHHQIAILGFHATAWTIQPLTHHAFRLHAALDRLGEGSLAQGTRLDLALAEAIATFQRPEHRAENQPVLVLLTDGLPNQVPTPTGGGSQEDTILALARQAKAAGIEIYTIGLGKPDATDPLARIDAELLRAMASEPSMYYQTPAAEELTATYRDIARRIPCPPDRYWGRR